ncbi:MAG: SDR family oxidoreductase [Pseudomonadota bacterium]
MRTLFSYGHGYSAQALTPLLLAQGFTIIGTTRSAEKAERLAKTGITPRVIGEDDLTADIAAATHILMSAAPGEGGDPFLASYCADVAASQAEWVGYLSTTGVYGDHTGGWVDENAALTPATKRGQMRVAAEAEWRALGLPLHIFRLAGIYGPGRGPFAKVRAGTARRIIKPGQVFSRIHVEDIAQILAASIARPNPGAVYNMCDDDPAPPQDVLAYAAELLDLPLPPEEDFATAEMTPMARSFYAESKKVRNDRIKDELGVELIYPDYRVGLQALLQHEE